MRLARAAVTMPICGGLAELSRGSLGGDALNTLSKHTGLSMNGLLAG